MRTMYGGHPHRVPSVSAPCTEAIRIVCRACPHHARRPFAPCAEHVLTTIIATFSSFSARFSE
ncbi:MAG: hypothetical protein K2M96_00445 [Prevotella sp.]|nr:hypothetical protein [Prevotella sp.]